MAGDTVTLLGGVMDGSLLPAGPFLVEMTPGFGIFAAVSTDGLPPTDSRQLRLSLLGWSEQRGTLYTDRALWSLLYPGQPPMRLEPRQARISLRRSPGVDEVRAYHLTWEAEHGEALEVTGTPTGIALELPGQGHYELLWE